MTEKCSISSRAPFASSWTKGYSSSLVVALETAWRKHKRDWSIDNITREQEVIFSREELIQAFMQMDNLAGDEPKPSAHEISAQVIREMGKDG